ncbi:MAG TPA: VIT and VWA domain-containing protein [Burkholderiaceae bacterium]|nr:VIT and VWA domain-containing protein [Burkholderiaceae bacterium]
MLTGTSLLRWCAATCAALLFPFAVGAAQAPDDDRTLSPYFAVNGAAPGVDALPLKSTRVDATVSGLIADVTVRQIYRNEGTTPLEARYVFPASTHAAVSGLRMRIGERVVDAEIREKQRARTEFAQAKRAGKSAALLEQHRINVFQMAIANVMPGDEIAVDLRYSEVIVPTDGVYRFVYPTVVGPRYAAPTEEGRGEDAGTAPPEGSTAIAHPILRKGEAASHTFELNLRLAAPLPIKAVQSPSHAIVVDGIGADQATVKLAPDRTHADRDVVVEYRLAASAIDAGVLLQQGRDENFFMALVEPPARVAGADIVPREYVFIVDISGSMHGFPLATAKKLLRNLIGGLRPTDTFNVIPFAGGVSMLAPESLAANGENIARALRFIDGQTGAGGTELLPALRYALALPADATRARTFVVVTDGYVSVEKQAYELVRANLNRANLFAFGIGSAVNRMLIEGLARAGKGEPFFVLGPELADAEAQRLRTMIEAPVLTRVGVSFAGFDAYEIDPPQIPDLFAQRPLVVIGKYRGAPSGSIVLEGVSAGGAWRRTIDVGSAKVAPVSGDAALRTLWARSRIATLMDDQRLQPDDPTRAEILRLGLAYGLLTDYTSFVAVDKVVRNPGGQGVDVDHPQPLPAGVEETALAAVPSTPEPQFYALATLAVLAMGWALRRRRLAEVRRG